MSLIKYIIRRILAFIPVLFGAVTLIFLLSRIMPGDPVTAYLIRMNISNPTTYEEMYDYISRELWIDRPIHMQYVRYIKDVFSGNWGYSISIFRGGDVWNLIIQRLPRTIDLALFSILISSFIGIKAGLFSAKHRNKFSDTLVRGLVLLGVSIPAFYMGILVQYYFSYKLRWFPATGFKSSNYDNPEFITGFRVIDCLISGEFYLIIDYLYHLILPVFCLTFITLAGITRHSRSSMLEILEQDYIRTARAKGCEEKDVYRIHVLKNSLISIITIIGLNLASLFSGAILIEITFGLNGIGKLLIEAIYSSDYWVLNAVVFVITMMFLITTLIMDLIYSFVDPRIRI
ncbi:MAG: ABC transporter permease [Candidatus Lokiarchaeota archaeon]|nr:ABC transporter permease [Candidatus Lokiarchaeota archaeon]